MWVNCDNFKGNFIAFNSSIVFISFEIDLSIHSVLANRNSVKCVLQIAEYGFHWLIDNLGTRINNTLEEIPIISTIKHMLPPTESQRNRKAGKVCAWIIAWNPLIFIRLLACLFEFTFFAQVEAIH